MVLEFTIPGEPNGQGRPRFTTINGHAKAYDPEKSRNYKAFVKILAMEAVKQCGWKCTELPVSVGITAYMGIPLSKPKKFKERALSGLERPAKKPDIDNIFKCVSDAISEIIYKDDKQIVESHIIKRYAETPCVKISVVEIGRSEDNGR